MSVEINCSLCCECCPFNYESEESHKVQGLGCLPTPLIAIQHFDENQISLSCHDTGKICRGLLQHRPEAINFPIRSYNDWYTNG